MPLPPKPLATSAKASIKSAMPKVPKVPGVGAKSIKSIKPTTPQVTISSPYLRAGLRGESVAPKGLTQSLGFHNSNRPTMKLNKSASMDEGTKQELLSTGIIGSIGAGTSMLTGRVLKRPGVIKRLSRLSEDARAGLVGGGLGILGDYAAVKAMKKIAPAETGANKDQHMNNELQKIAQINTLINEGYSLFEAANLVKEAARVGGRARRMMDNITRNSKASAQSAAKTTLSGTGLIVRPNSLPAATASRPGSAIMVRPGNAPVPQGGGPLRVIDRPLGLPNNVATPAAPKPPRPKRDNGNVTDVVPKPAKPAASKPAPSSPAAPASEAATAAAGNSRIKEHLLANKGKYALGGAALGLGGAGAYAAQREKQASVTNLLEKVAALLE